MKHLNRLVGKIFIATILTLSCYTAKADPEPVAGEITYTWLNDSTYRFFVRYYDYCNYPEPTTLDLCFYNSCTQSTFAVTMQKYGIQTMMKTYCPGMVNRCNLPSSNMPGYEETVYSAVVTIPLRCNWKIFCNLGPREGNANISIQYMALVAYFDNSSGRLSNSSPVFHNEPIRVVGLNQACTFNNLATDPDADSLVTEVINPLTSSGACNNVTNANFSSANPAYSIPNNPLQTNNTFTINSKSGQMSFTPTQLGLYQVAINVKEYRGGNLIGSVTRECLFIVVSGITNTISGNVVSNTATNCVYNGTVNVCQGQTFSFCYDLKSTNTASVLVVSDDHITSAAGATISYSGQNTDSVRGCLLWTPTFSDTGIHSLTINVLDSTCLPPYFYNYYTYTIPIYIWGKTTIIKDTTICNGASVTLQATKGGNYTWSVLSGTTGSLSCTVCNNVTVNPSATSKYIVTSGANTFCPNLNKDTATVTVLPTTTPSVIISANPGGPVAKDSLINFTAIPTNCSSPVYQWKVNGNNISGATNTTWGSKTLNNNDVVTCVMTCNDPCPVPKTATSNSYKTSIVPSSVGDIYNNGFQLYPNPGNGLFILKGSLTQSGKGKINAEVLNYTGQIVYKISWLQNGTDINKEIDLNGMPDGVYVLRISANGVAPVNLKLVISH